MNGDFFSAVGGPIPFGGLDSTDPLTFKVLDVMTSQVLVEGVDARAVIDLLEDFSSLVDVRIYARPLGARRWRLLGVDEQRVLWGFRGIRAGAA